MQNPFEELLQEFNNSKTGAEEEYRAFVNDFWQNPDKLLSTVILGHIYLELRINKILERALSSPKKILEYNFARKLDVIESIGLAKPEIINKLRVINSIRNRLAHEHNWSITEADVKKLSRNAKDIVKWRKNKSGFMFGEISYLAGYLSAIFAGQQEIRPRSYSVEELNKLSKFFTQHTKTKGRGG